MLTLEHFEISLPFASIAQVSMADKNHIRMECWGKNFSLHKAWCSFILASLAMGLCMFTLRTGSHISIKKKQFRKK